MEWLFMGLRYAIVSLPFVFAILFAVVGFWMVVATASRPAAGAWVVGGAFLVETILGVAPGIPLGFRLTTNDMAFMLLAGALVMRSLFFGMPRRPAVYGVWLAFGAVLFISFGMGLSSHGSAAGVEVRPNFYFWMAGLYFASFHYPPHVLGQLWRITQWCAWLVAAIAVYRWLGPKVGIAVPRLEHFSGANSEFRVIGSNPTFFLALAGVAYFSLWLSYSRRLAFFAAFVMLGFVLVLQHRSVWVATLASLALAAWHQREFLRGKLLPVVAMCVVMTGLLATFIAFDPSNRLVQTVGNAASAVTEAEGTHIDRLHGWKELLRDFSSEGLKTWALGYTYGSGYERWVDGRFVDYAPHNFYVQLLLRVGALGLLLFLWAHLSLRRSVLALDATDPAAAAMRAVFLAVLAANLLYFIPYQGFYLQGAFYGVLMGYLTASAAPGPAFGAVALGQLEGAR